MSGLYRAFDAAYPPPVAPPSCQAVLGYIGGKRALNIWHLAEWKRFASLRQFPCYVPSLSAEKPVDAAVAACSLAKAIGWAPWQEEKRAIICDLETAVVRGWYAKFAAEVEQQGFVSVAYGSLSMVLENAASQVWAASWDNSPVLLDGQTIRAHQYQKLSSVDYSVMDQWLFDRGGRGARHT